MGALSGPSQQSTGREKRRRGREDEEEKKRRRGREDEEEGKEKKVNVESIVMFSILYWYRNILKVSFKRLFFFPVLLSLSLSLFKTSSLINATVSLPPPPPLTFNTATAQSQCPHIRLN